MYSCIGLVAVTPCLIIHHINVACNEFPKLKKKMEPSVRGLKSDNIGWRKRKCRTRGLCAGLFICHFIHVISATLHFTPKTIKCEDLSLLGCYLYRLVNGSPTCERIIVPFSSWLNRPRRAILGLLEPVNEGGTVLRKIRLCLFSDMVYHPSTLPW